MGNLCSRSHGIAKAEDSMHVMISHDKKAALKRGEAGVGGYVPRAEHPALAKAREKQEQEQHIIPYKALFFKEHKEGFPQKVHKSIWFLNF